MRLIDNVEFTSFLFSDIAQNPCRLSAFVICKYIYENYHSIYSCQHLILLLFEWVSESRSVMSDSAAARTIAHQALLCPWDSPGKNIGVRCHFLLQGIFPNQGSNPALLIYLLLVLLPFGLYPTGFFGNCAYV